MKKLFLALVLLTGSALASNDLPRYKSIGDFVNNEMKTQSDYMLDYEKVSDQELSVDSSYYLNVIRLRLRAIIGIEAPIFASFEIKPMLELRWKRKNPKGMTAYKPTF